MDRLTGHLDMTIIVDLDVKQHSNKQTTQDKWCHKTSLLKEVWLIKGGRGKIPSQHNFFRNKGLLLHINCILFHKINHAFIFANAFMSTNNNNLKFICFRHNTIVVSALTWTSFYPANYFSSKTLHMTLDDNCLTKTFFFYYYFFSFIHFL